MKLVTTEVKNEEYTVYDKNVDREVKTFTDIDELLIYMNDYSRKMYGKTFRDLYQTEKKKTYVHFKNVTKEYYFDTHVDEHGDVITIPRSRDVVDKNHLFGFHVTDSLGDVVDVYALNKRESRWKYDSEGYKAKQRHREEFRSTLVPTAGNPAKIKETYAHKEDLGGNPRYAEEFTEYKFKISRYFRHIKTFHVEKSVAAVIKEDGEPDYRGKVVNVPSSWDDIHCNIWKQQKSWKHNSKRKKQWKVDPSTVDYN